MKDSKKRKREEEGSNTIITFYAPNDRIFDRVFRGEESSLKTL